MKTHILKLLKEMGMTEYESRAFSTLLERGMCSAEGISKFSEIPLTRVYETLSSLEKRGLVVVLHTRPKKYRLVSVDALKNLVEEKKEKMKTEVKKIEHVYRKIYSMAPKTLNGTVNDVEKDDIWVFKGRKNCVRAFIEALKHTKKEISIFETDLSHLPECYNVLKKRIDDGIKVKILCNINEKTQKTVNKVQEMGVEIREWQGREGVETVGYVVDSQRVYVISKLPRADVNVENHYGKPGTDALFSYECIKTDNPSLVRIINTYFKHFWNR